MCKCLFLTIYGICLLLSHISDNSMSSVCFISTFIKLISLMSAMYETLDIPCMPSYLFLYRCQTKCVTRAHSIDAERKNLNSEDISRLIAAKDLAQCAIESASTPYFQT